jgi:tetratricopeptide (TPR) repeat protein
MNRGPLVAACLLVSLSLCMAAIPAMAQKSALPSVSSQSASAEPEIPHLRQEIDRGQIAGAIKQLNALKERQAVPAGVDRLLGLAYYQQGKFAKADAAFVSALADDPHDTEAAQLRGLTLFRLGRPAQAIPLLESAESWTAHTHVDPSYVLALCYLQTRQYDNARHAFAHQYGFAPDSAPAYLIAARMLFRQNDPEEARQYAEKALTLNVNLPHAHELLGELALARQDPGAAIAELEKEQAVNPLDGSVYDRLGDAYVRAGNYAQAEQALQRAVLLEPTATGPYILLGKALLADKDPSGAVMYLERAEKMDANNRMTHWLLAQAYRELGREADAARESAITSRLTHSN